MIKLFVLTLLFPIASFAMPNGPGWQHLSGSDADNVRRAVDEYKTNVNETCAGSVVSEEGTSFLSSVETYNRIFGIITAAPAPEVWIRDGVEPSIAFEAGANVSLDNHQTVYISLSMDQKDIVSEELDSKRTWTETVNTGTISHPDYQKVTKTLATTGLCNY